jgi:glycosyltransferase involved in cell wall biosynthesis
LPLGLGRKGIRTVVTIHDLIFLRYPQYYKPIDRMIYRIKFRFACRHADRIIAVSECTKRDIVSFFHVPEQKIEVVYQGCHPAFYETVPPEKRQSVAAKYRLPPLFILNVGSIEARKNLALIVKALPYIPDDVHLVAAGKPTPYQQEVEGYARRAGIASRLHLLNEVASEDLPAIYQSAALCVYPSFSEGFGIPVVEALASGIPVIAASGSCLEEAGGTGSIYVDPSNERELSEQIMAVLNDQEMARRMVETGREHIKRFAGKRIAADVIRVYKSVQ